jgi:hypothetical protein
MEGFSRRVSNVGIRSRIRQLLILAITILLGVIISSAVQAQDFHRAKKRHFKTKYKTQISQGKRECHLLSKKRNTRPASPLFAKRIRRPKYKPQAEVDAPGSGRDSLIAANK